jgi:hypothetical protein
MVSANRETRGSIICNLLGGVERREQKPESFWPA